MNFHRDPITFVGHVHLRVQDLERALTFYQEVIGFKVLEKNDRLAQLTADGKTALLTLEQPDDVSAKQRRTTGLYHFALLLPHRSDLANIVYHLAAHGVQIGASDHLVSEALYLSDPDGNGIEIYTDRDPSEWRWHNNQVTMTTDPLNIQDLLTEGEQNAWKGLPAQTVMGHIHLHVSELDRTEEFYTKGLGFEVVTRYGTQALFISDGKYHHHIGLNTWNGVGAPQPSHNSVGMKYYTLEFASEEKRNQVMTQLKAIGAPVEETNGSFVTTDPSGNRIYLNA